MIKKKAIGQSLVEFALIIPILLLLILGALELGRLFYIKVALHNAAREGAYYLTYNPGDIEGMKGAIVMEGTSVGVNIDPDNDITWNNCCNLGDYVEVEVRQDNVSLFIFGFITGEVDLSSKVRMMVQNGT